MFAALFILIGFYDGFVGGEQVHLCFCIVSLWF